MNETQAGTKPGIKPLDSSSPFSKRRVPSLGIPREPKPTAGTPIPEISIIAPLRNESANVLPLVERIFTALREDPRPLELILVDDASTDQTWHQILEAQRSDPRVRAIRHVRHCGQSAGLWTGFEASRGQIIATLDGDLQNDPADLPNLLNELANSDLVCGVRTKRKDNAVRRISSSIARWFRRTVLGLDFRDIGCNFRVFKRPVLQTLLPFDGLHRFMPVLAYDAGAVVKEVAISHLPRTAGRSKYGVWNRLGRGLWDISMIAWYRRRQLRIVQVIENVHANIH